MSAIPGTGAMTPLSEVVDKLAILQGNTKRNHYLAYLIHAEQIWKRLLRNTIWSVRYRKIDVPDNRIIDLPNDCERFVSLCVVDHCGNLQSLTYNANLNTLQLLCAPKTHSCSKCDGIDTLCAVLDDIVMTTEVVVLGGDDYIKKSWIRMDAFGNLESVVDMPVWDVATEAVVRDIQHKIIEALDVDEKCCIQPTERNRGLLYTHCGAYLRRCDELILPKRGQVNFPALNNDFGHWRWVANHDRKIQIQNPKITQVIVAYQSDGSESVDELLIPDYAIDAMHFGIMWRQVAFNPTKGPRDTREAERAFQKAETHLQKFLSPIDVDEFMQIQSINPIWG